MKTIVSKLGNKWEPKTFKDAWFVNNCSEAYAPVGQAHVRVVKSGNNFSLQFKSKSKWQASRSVAEYKTARKIIDTLEELVACLTSAIQSQRKVG